MTRKPIGKSLRFDVLNRDGFRCRYCGADATTTELHIDHRTPVALGGGNEIDNLLTACIACNLGKRTKLANLEDDLPDYGIDCPFADGWPNGIEDPVYFVNATWAITDFGLERLAKFYVIEADSLRLHSPNPGKEHISLWLEHLATKLWAIDNFDDTIEAVARALRFYGDLPEFDWQASVEFARKRVAEQLAYRKVDILTPRSLHEIADRDDEL